ncbi:phosphatidylserine decarboxylase-domain-containing protein [Pisolithus tinctorius]|uniref:L-tryptophan decarboxylase PsiD-like domain-containing protein n=1 Tax=Pisolithus tinctorius Marx 270 TaxID=870435 RepID=A0A0C3PY59_PISTI|nr:phosphatidylserine decarboxylase-domain-containing protein [Pisolithus tinctorius]KIO14496.1 hypothetical protein M404DRAFT_17411 [Pisolithus tinctorius Marx 270]
MAPKDPAVIDAFVGDLLERSRFIHGRHPKTRAHFAAAGENLETTMNKANVKFDLCRLRAHYRFAPGQAQVYIVRALHPIVQEFKDYIEKEGVVYAAFNQMFEQALLPQSADQAKIEGCGLLGNDQHAFDGGTQLWWWGGGGASDMAAAVPYYAIISRFCNTPGGYSAFTFPGVNERFCKVFIAWNKNLASVDSTNVIHDGEGGWLSTVALNAIVQHAGGNPGQDTFDNFYICDTSDPHYGFKSYDEFFIKELKPVYRAVVFPDDPKIVNLGCTSTICQLYENLKKTDRFWLKNTPSSLNHMLAEDGLVDTFVGGTLFQAMLASFDYRRWRSPVNGMKTRLISGLTHPNSPPTYYADFVTAISSRALIFIQADEPVGLMCFVDVGLCEVSTCGLTVKEDQVLKKGNELGMFHFGGSTHCLVFRGGVTVTPIDQDGNDLVGSKVRVGKDILIVSKQA